MHALSGRSLAPRYTPPRLSASRAPALSSQRAQPPLQRSRVRVRVASTPPQTEAQEEQPGGLIGLERAINHAVVDSTVLLFDTFYATRPYARFYVLETIARVPYFAFLSVLHLYETLGWWRRSDYLKVHFSESWNELHHLLIMESLGGDKLWVDRFFAQHCAVAYYWVTCGMCVPSRAQTKEDALTQRMFFVSRRSYFASPRMAYHLMELIEEHAFETYDQFLVSDGELLKSQPVPDVARRYYENAAGDQYLFDEFQTGSPVGARRPTLGSLYDVFVAIRDDEGQHCTTMRTCQTSGKLGSPHAGTQAQAGAVEGDTCEGVVECAVTAPTGWRSGAGETAAPR